MKKIVKKEVEKLIKELELNCSIEEFKDKLDNKFDNYMTGWGCISVEKKLSLSFIREFKDKINWFHVSLVSNLSETFIKEFKNKVNWYWITRHQKLSEQFIYEFQDKLDIDYLIENDKITKNRLLELREVNIINSRFDILDIR